MTGFLMIDDLLNLKQPGDAQIHPDGGPVAYTLSSAVGEKGNHAGSSEIRLVDRQGRDRRVSAKGTHARRPRWSPDGARLAFLGRRKSEKQHQLQLLDRDWGEARTLTKLKAGVRSFAWSPDGDAITLLATDPPPEDAEERKEEGRDWVEYETEQRFSRLWRYDLDSGDLRRMIDADLQVYEYAWSPSGARLVAIAASQPFNWAWYRARLVQIEVESGTVRTLHEGDRQFARPAWSPDGRWVSVITCTFSDEGMTGGDVLLIDPDDGTARNITDGHPRSYLEVHWDADGQGMLCPAVEDGEAALGRLSLDGEWTPLWREKSAIQLYGGSALSRTESGERVAMVISSPLAPPDVWMGEIGNAAVAWERLSDANPGRAGREAGEVAAVHWESFDGRVIQGFVVRPKGAAPDEPLPTITLVHGGPTGLSSYGFPDTRTLGWAHLLAAEGYLSFLPNYRGSMGFGVEFAEANNRDLGGGDLHDVLTGVDHCVSQGWADPERLGIGGWSYGGYLTPWAITQTPRFKAAVSGASITNWTSFHGGSTIQGFDETFNRADPHNADGYYTFRSPIYSVAAVQTPTLFLHGERDPICPLGQAHEMFRALIDRAIETQLIIYPREPHGLREREHVRDLLERVVRWFRERV